MRFFSRRREEDLIDEIDTHLALAEDEYLRGGMSDTDARDAARRALGGELKTRLIYAEGSRWHWLDRLRQDLGFGVRSVMRDRAFALTAVLVLGIGIGVNNMQFTIIYTHTLRPLPIARAERVLMGSLVDERGVDRGVSYAEYLDLLVGADLFEGIAAFGAISSVALGDRGRAPDRHLGVYTTANAFDLLRIQPVAGRTFSAEEQQPGATRVAMLGGGAWRTRYNSDPSIVGREVLVDGKPTVIVGIIGERSGFPSAAELFLPIPQAPRFSMQRDQRMLRTVGRVRDAASIDEAQAQLSTTLMQTARSTGETARTVLPSVGPITTRFRGRASDPAWIAFFAVGFLVVAVAAANTANLMLARGVRRGREIAIRGSLGASRRRIVLQLLTESVVVAAAGAVVGGAVSIAGVRLFEWGVPPDAMPYWFQYSMDTTIFAALVAVSFSTVVIFGLVPALQISKIDTARVLKDGGWGGSGRMNARWLTTSFMVAQLGLSVVLMSYVVHDLVDEDTTTPTDQTIETSDLLTAAISLPLERYPSPAQRAVFLAQLEEQTRAVPGVEAFSVTSVLPWNGATRQRLERTGVAREQLPEVWSLLVGSDYFETLQVSLTRGREFTAAESSQVSIVNERFVELHFAERDPIGQLVTLRSEGGDENVTAAMIIGVAPDIRHTSGPAAPLVYLPIAAAAPPQVAVMLRSSVDTATATRQLRDAVAAIDQNLPVHQVMTLARAVRDAGWPVRVSARLVTALSLIVLVLSGAGLYAVTAHSVSQRAKEIGIRIAVGARPSQIRRLVLSQAAVHLSVGLIFGIVCTWAWDRAFSNAGAERHFTDPRVLTPIAGVLVTVMALACIAPVRRALRLDPVETLRQD